MFDPSQVRLDGGHAVLRCGSNAFSHLALRDLLEDPALPFARVVAVIDPVYPGSSSNRCSYVYIYIYEQCFWDAFGYPGSPHGGSGVIFHLFTRLWHQVMHPETYMEPLASTKQVSDLRKLTRGPFSWILLRFVSVSVYLVSFVMSSHDSEGMEKTRNAIWSRSVSDFWRELYPGPVW